MFSQVGANVNVKIIKTVRYNVGVCNNCNIYKKYIRRPSFFVHDSPCLPRVIFILIR